ncbi:MAG: OstA-like protein, partial [Candidatus Kapaibacterium sp.]
MTMMMPKGEYDGMRSIATGTGGVRITDRSMDLRAPEAEYHSTTAIVEFADGVTMDDDSMMITAERGRYSRSTQESWAWGDVVVRNTRSAAVLAGDSAYHRPADAYSRIDGHAMLERTQTSSGASEPAPGTGTDALQSSSATPTPKDRVRKGRKRTNTMQPAVADTQEPARSAVRVGTVATAAVDTLTIAAWRMESFRRPAEERYVATGEAEIIRGRMATRSRSCVFEATTESFRLRGEPRLWADSLSLIADSIDVDFTNRSLHAVHADGTAFLLLGDSASAGRSQQIGAETIDITVTDDTIRRVSGIRSAASLYFMQDDAGPAGASRTACDSLFVLFTAGQVDTIVWRSGVSSEYYPENLIGDGVARYYLPSYREIGSRPVKARFGHRREKEAEIRRRCGSADRLPSLEPNPASGDATRTFDRKTDKKTDKKK